MPKKPSTCIMRTMTSMVGKAPLTKMLMKTQSNNVPHSRNVACHNSLVYESSAFKMTRFNVRSATKKQTDVKAAIQPTTVSHPLELS